MGKETLPLSLSLLSHFCRTSPQHRVSPACSSSPRCLSLDGTRRPGGTSSSLTAFSKAKFILILCLRKGSRQLQRRPGTWRGKRGNEANPQGITWKGGHTGPCQHAPANGLWEHRGSHILQSRCLQSLNEKCSYFLLISNIKRAGSWYQLARDRKTALGFFFFFNTEISWLSVTEGFSK